MTYENRAINLDDVVVPAGKVVTGVRFAHRNGHVLLEVRGTTFNYADGKLKHLNKSVWYSNKNAGKDEIRILNRMNPHEKYNDAKLYVPQKSNDSYIRFGPSDFKTDLGQTTIPLIETAWLQADCPTALSGIGLAYANDETRSTGGVIIPKLIGYEFPMDDSPFHL